MASQINEHEPANGSAMLSAVLRDNFRHAKDEIEELQDNISHPGHAERADRLSQSRNFTVVPDQTGHGSFNGTANVSIGVAPQLSDLPASDELPSASEPVSLTALLNQIRSYLKYLHELIESHHP